MRAAVTDTQPFTAVRQPCTTWTRNPAVSVFLFFQAEDGIRYLTVTGVQTCALPISWMRRGESDLHRPSLRPAAGAVEIALPSTHPRGGLRSSPCDSSRPRRQWRIIWIRRDRKSVV